MKYSVSVHYFRPKRNLKHDEGSTHFWFTFGCWPLVPVLFRLSSKRSQFGSVEEWECFARIIFNQYKVWAGVDCRFYGVRSCSLAWPIINQVNAVLMAYMECCIHSSTVKSTTWISVNGTYNLIAVYTLLILINLLPHFQIPCNTQQYLFYPLF